VLSCGARAGVRCGLRDWAAVSRLGPVLIAATACIAFVVSACSVSPSARLSKDLIPVSATQPAAWGLRIASGGQTLNPFGAQPSGAPLGTPSIASPQAVAIRQWIHGSGTVTAGPLPEGIFSVIDRAAQYPSAADARALLADLSSGFGTGSSQPVAGLAGATLLTAPFTFDVLGGRLTGHEDLVIIERGDYVFTVLVVGGGSRPTSSDAQAFATLQAEAIPATLS
jgi:hypothetical protein